jgi:hypothetical protein
MVCVFIAIRLSAASVKPSENRGVLTFRSRGPPVHRPCGRVDAGIHGRMASRPATSRKRRLLHGEDSHRATGTLLCSDQAHSVRRRRTMRCLLNAGVGVRHGLTGPRSATQPRRGPVAFAAARRCCARGPGGAPSGRSLVVKAAPAHTGRLGELGQSFHQFVKHCDCSRVSAVE